MIQKVKLLVHHCLRNSSIHISNGEIFCSWRSCKTRMLINQYDKYTSTKDHALSTFIAVMRSNIVIQIPKNFA